MVPKETQQFESMAFCYLEQLFRLAYTRVGNTQDAEDIVQETYLKAYRSFGSFKHGANIKSWLTQILINNVRDHFRKAARTVATVEIADLFEECATQPVKLGPEDELCNAEIDPLLMRALSSMPHILVMPLLLREIDDASYEEIAGLLDIPIGTVMSRLSRARSLLRKKLLLDSDRSPDQRPDSSASPSRRRGAWDGDSNDQSRGSSHEVQ